LNEGKKKYLLLKPETVLTLIYSNNIKILKLVEESQINEIIRYLKENEPHERYFNILSSMCICNNSPIIVKQKAICNTLTNNNYEVDTQVSWDIEIVDEDVMVNIPKNKLKLKFDDSFVYNGVDVNGVNSKELSQK
jgi:hypothetical protein